jgi:hypothetical protein
MLGHDNLKAGRGHPRTRQRRLDRDLREPVGRCLHRRALRSAGSELLADHHPEEEEMTRIVIASLALLYVLAGAELGIIWIIYLIIQALSP